ncbi:DNA adenine methylase [Salipaludibacillus sp. CF4.18]|uniref:DNA adenine methylase n=1 Tax=Salipaludibacillus sp. CF4.18 TaxID=3373081 RepID=UPI003EE50A58
MPKRLKSSDPLATLGGKSQIIEIICEIIEGAIEEYELVGAADYFMGGCRLFLHLDPERELDFKLANEIDIGVINLFRCLQDPYETDELIEAIWLMADYYTSEEEFNDANIARLNEETPQVESAALTYIVSKYSRAADRQIFCLTNTFNGIPPKSLDKLYHLEEILDEVDITCGDYKEQFYKHTHRDDIISWFDPPYVKTEKTKGGQTEQTKETYGYLHPFTLEDQKTLIDNLLTTNNKVILSGYDNDLYKALNKKNGFYKHFIGLVTIPSSVSGRKEKEYIWVNFEIPEWLLPEEPHDDEL